MYHIYYTPRPCVPVSEGRQGDISIIVHLTHSPTIQILYPPIVCTCRDLAIGRDAVSSVMAMDKFCKIFCPLRIAKQSSAKFLYLNSILDATLRLLACCFL